MENLLLKQLEQKNLSSPWQPDSTVTTQLCRSPVQPNGSLSLRPLQASTYLHTSLLTPAPARIPPMYVPQLQHQGLLTLFWCVQDILGDPPSLGPASPASP